MNYSPSVHYAYNVLFCLEKIKSQRKKHIFKIIIKLMYFKKNKIYYITLFEWHNKQFERN